MKSGLWNVGLVLVLSQAPWAGSCPVSPPCLGVAWAVILYFCIIMYRENIVINRVREDVAKQRYKQAFSKVRKGVIVCVSHCIVPPEIPKMSGSEITSPPP